MNVESPGAESPRPPQGREARDAAASEFFARAAYAIRSPINIILGYSELIARRLSALGDDSQRPYVEGIRRSGRQVLETINRILDYSRIEQCILVVMPERIDLAGMMQRLAQDYRVLAASRRLGVVCEIGEPGAGVRCDAYCLTAALSNLLDNAIKFTHTGGVLIKLGRDHLERLCIEVRDTGEGFDPVQLKQALAGAAKTYDGQAGDAQNGAGTNAGDGQNGGAHDYEQSGLGLLLTHKYLELIGAALAISSSPGRGSAVTISFPAALEVHWKSGGAPGNPAAAIEPLPRLAATGAPPPLAAKGAAPPDTVAGARVANKSVADTIVVVEDQPDQALFMRALLQDRYRVAVAANAAEAIAQLDLLGQRVSLVLMDISLPGGADGLTLSRRIRSERRWHRLPIVVTTAHGFEGDRERALAAGCNAYLAKPIDPGELMATVARLIGPDRS